MDEEKKTGNVEETPQELADRLMGKDQTEEELLAEAAKSRNLADATEIFTHAIIKQKLELPSVGAFVEYMPLRPLDRVEINTIVDINQDVQRDMRNRKKVFLLLNRADKRYTEVAIENLSAAIVDAILLEYEMQEDSHFLLPILSRRSDGLRQTPRRRN